MYVEFLLISYIDNFAETAWQISWFVLCLQILFSKRKNAPAKRRTLMQERTKKGELWNTKEIVWYDQKICKFLYYLNIDKDYLRNSQKTLDNWSDLWYGTVSALLEPAWHFTFTSEWQIRIPEMKKASCEEVIKLLCRRLFNLTTHESQLMDLQLLRRDEINFINKDDNGFSTIYSLDKFDVRFDKKVVTEYLKGRYGAIPTFETLNQ